MKHKSRRSTSQVKSVSASRSAGHGKPAGPRQSHQAPSTTAAAAERSSPKGSAHPLDVKDRMDIGPEANEAASEKPKGDGNPDGSDPPESSADVSALKDRLAEMKAAIEDLTALDKAKKGGGRTDTGQSG